MSPAFVIEAEPDPPMYPDLLAVYEYVPICKLPNDTVPDELVVPVPEPMTDAPEIRALVALSRTYTVIAPTGVSLIVTVVLCADKLIVALPLLER